MVEAARSSVGESQEPDLEPEIAADLVRQIGQGVRAAETAMIERYAGGLLFMLKRRTRDMEIARDIRQDAFRVAIEKLRVESIDQPERLGAYLRGVALNLWLAERRKDTRRATTADSAAIETVADQRGGPFDDVSSEQVKRAVSVLLAELRTPRDREILTRLYLQEEEKDSICRALGIDSEHFNRVLFRAKQRFRELLTRAEQRRKLRLVG
jgi:RNA polymerase sigma-70 factor (ECF subfamily)